MTSQDALVQGQSIDSSLEMSAFPAMECPLVTHAMDGRVRTRSHRWRKIACRQPATTRARRSHTCAPGCIQAPKSQLEMYLVETNGGSDNWFTSKGHFVFSWSGLLNTPDLCHC
jgi:hypothetical protein